MHRRHFLLTPLALTIAPKMTFGRTLTQPSILHQVRIPESVAIARGIHDADGALRFIRNAEIDTNDHSDGSRIVAEMRQRTDLAAKMSNYPAYAGEHVWIIWDGSTDNLSNKYALWLDNRARRVVPSDPIGFVHTLCGRHFYKEVVFFV